MAASIRARLANKARESQRPFQEVLQYYGLERFLYRFSRTEHCDRFLLQGAWMLRMKDFFDIWLLARQFVFAGAELATSIAKTFANRETELDADPVALTTAFTTAGTTSNQWSAFIRRSNLDSAPATLEEIREPLRQFLIPVITANAEGRDFTGSWPAGGPWHMES